ncbi:MAG: tetratricopeptide repeat protein, partial [Armatimonadota bacterium]|nr:tetratricopeptide repeat protein [Armatimonadota bacterium]
QYLACLGPISLVGWVLAVRWGKLSFARHLISAVILVVLAFLTWRQGHAYKDAETLWRHTIAANPKSALAHNNLANILSRKGNRDEAIEHYYEALKYNPKLAEAHLNLGIALVEVGRPEEAIGYYNETIRLAPNFADAHFNLGVALSKLGKGKEAVEEYLEAIRLKPNYAEAHSNLGIELVAQRRLDEAIFHFTKALEIKPEYAEAHNNLAAALYFKGDYVRAQQEIQLCEKYGGRPHPGLIKAISEKLKKSQ